MWGGVGVGVGMEDGGAPRSKFVHRFSAVRVRCESDGLVVGLTNRLRGYGP
jgi:hypothetical protein